MLQWKSHGTRIRWPELDTGANSVRPWVMPRTIACRMLVGRSLRMPGERWGCGTAL
jgi:hypothetical protein